MKRRMVLGMAGVMAVISAFADDTINMSSPAEGEGWTVEANVVTIKEGGSYVLTGSSGTHRVVVAAGVKATVTLENVSITSAVAAPFELSSGGANVTLRLTGNNTLTSTSSGDTAGYAGLQVEGAGTQLTIEGEGSLIAQGGVGGAGIGSGMIAEGASSLPGTIIIRSGTIVAAGGYYAAGIGGGKGSNGGNISISGGFVTANGNYHAAGIGGGEKGNGGNISISGGVVLAIHPGGQGDPAAIGGGWQGQAGNVSISGGSVCAYGNAGPGIGNGAAANNGGSIIIEGGFVVANRIGIALRAWDGDWHTGSLTPAHIDGSLTTVITDTTTAVNFGNAKVTTGADITEKFVRTMALTEADKLVYVHDTVWTVEYDTITWMVHDTVVKEVPGPTVTVHDTIVYVIRETVRETVFYDIHDTLTVWDTLTVHDTLRIVLHDTFSYVSWDTAYIEVPTAEITYIIVDAYAGTEHEVRDTLHAMPYGEDDLYWLSGGLGAGEFIIYDLNGHIVLRATSLPVRLTESGTFIVGQNGNYFKLVK